MPAPNLSVNLLPKDPFLDSLIGKFLVWSLSIGRYLVVFTELIVILSFLSRFKLDRDLTDLNEQIERQKTIIQSYADTEQNFNAAQTKIIAIKQNQANQVVTTSLDQIETSLPVDIKLNYISFQPQSWSVEGSALSPYSLRQLVTQVITNNPKAEVSLSKVKLNSQTGTTDFALSLNYPTTTIKK